MQRRALYRPGVIILVLILQFVPLLLFPAASFASTTQEWWLPVLLAIMVLVADIQLVVRRSPAATPWYLIAFAQGFNIISRLMMLWSHAVLPGAGANVINWPYVVMTFLAMGMSAFVLWYCEKPEVRMGLLRTRQTAAKTSGDRSIPAA
jgi:hypothetical protein